MILLKILGLVTTILILLYGLRLITVAGQTALTGRVLVRRGLKTTWEPAANFQEALNLAFRNGLMGLLLIILALVILT